MLAVAGAPPAAADHVTQARISGATRFDTAASIATTTFQAADVAHLVTGEAFPDALAASFAAGAAQSPILLTQPDEVPEPTLQALESLGVATVVVVGGPQAISDAVQAQLDDLGYSTDRITGINRYQTAAAVAMRYGTEQVGTIEGQRVALLASGANFPDALAAGPIAAAGGFPLFLTPPDQTEVSVNTSLQQLEIDVILLLGGEAAVSSAVEQYYTDQGYTVERVAGSNRAATAVMLADMARNRLGWDMGLQLLARADDYPDALAASIAGAQQQAPVLLTAPDSLSPETAQWLTQNCPDVDGVHALGGEDAVSEATLGAAVDAANTCEHPAGVELTQSCTFSAAGFEIEVAYPDGWYTNATEPTPDGMAVPPCRVFHSEPFELPRSTELLAYDLLLHVDRVSFDVVADADDPMHEVLSSQSTAVAGRPAHVAELRALETGLSGPQGSRHYRYAVDLGSDRTLIVRTHEVADLAYERNKRVLDIVMRALALRADESAMPVGEPRSEPYQSPDFPSQAGDVRYLTDVRAGAHEGFDRVVLEFANAEEPPPFLIEYVQPPILKQPSGLETDVAGSAFLEVTTSASSGVDLTGDEPVTTYDGPEEFSVGGTTVLREVARTSDWENVMSWVLGMDGRVPYSFDVLDEPVRLVIDLHGD